MCFSAQELTAMIVHPSTYMGSHTLPQIYFCDKYVLGWDITKIIVMITIIMVMIITIIMIIFDALLFYYIITEEMFS